MDQSKNGGGHIQTVAQDAGASPSPPQPTTTHVAIKTIPAQFVTGLSSHCCTVALLHCCTVALLHCCTVALLHCCTVALLHCCTVALLHCCTVALLHCCTEWLVASHKPDTSPAQCSLDKKKCISLKFSAHIAIGMPYF